jgi:hypothetical protein
MAGVIAPLQPRRLFGKVCAETSSAVRESGKVGVPARISALRGK